MEARETAITHTGPARQAFRILHFGFTVAPFIAGLDKFFDFLVDWGDYMAPIFANIIPPEIWMPIVGVIEMAAGILVWFRPRIGGLIVAAWLWGIILNLLLHPGSYDATAWGLDIALRDLGLSLGALALASLAAEFQRSR